MTFSTEKKVGVFFLATLILLGVVIEFIEDWSPFEKKDSYHAYFVSAVGIRPGDPVRLSGVEVGKILTIGIERNQVRVDFYVQDGTGIREDSMADVQQTNFLGGYFLGISFGTPDRPFLPEDSAINSRETVSINQLIGNLNQNQEKVLGELGRLLQETRDTFSDTVKRLNGIVTRVDEGEGTLGRLINDPKLYEDFHETLLSLKTVMGRLQEGEGSFGRFLKDPVLYEEAKETFTNLRQISDSIADGQGTFGRFVKDEKLYQQTVETMETIAVITKKIDSGEGTLGRLLNDPGLYDDARETIGRVRNISEKIDGGEGTLGKLVNDEGLYLEARATLKKVEKTVDGLSDAGPLSALGVVVGTLF